MSAVLHQLVNPERREACLARVSAGDILVAFDVATMIADEMLPAGVEQYLVGAENVSAKSVQHIDDAQWVALLARFPLNMTW